MQEIEKDNNTNNTNNNSEEPMNNPYLYVKDHFKAFIKNKSIEELIAYDNTLFSEVRNLESEKHILIKSSLIGFEKDLYTLQNKVQNLVSNYEVVNNSIEGKLKETENIYKIKKDLKRLKFINDLPRVLETQLNEYLSNEKGDLKVLEKSLTYYEKCKEFLNLHKENSLVKDIYNRTIILIFKYRNLIQDELHIPEFTDSNLEKFNLCLSLLVKIDEDKSELIFTFMDCYKYLLNKKFDEIFGMRESASEIDFSTYIKIYDNYEFAINENEFLFYENQIENESEKMNTFNTNLDIKKLSSKYFKKGTFIWICKKIQENIISNFLILSYKNFTNLFDKRNSGNLNVLFNNVVDIFFKKIKDIVEQSKFNNINLTNKCNPDPIFFHEGILSFYIPFCEILQKLNDDKICCGNLSEKMLKNNKNLIQMYINNLEFFYVTKITELIQIGVKNMIAGKKDSIKCPETDYYFNLINFDPYFFDNTNTFNKIISLLQENLLILKKLELGKLLGTTPEETNTIYLTNIISFISVFYFVLKSVDILKFDNIKLEKSFDENNLLRTKINEILNPITKERIYTKIILCKIPFTNGFGFKNLADKILKDFPNIKNNKAMYSDVRSYLDKETNETLNCLFDSLVQLTDKEIFVKLQNLFYNVDWLNYEKAISFRLELRNLCYDLFYLKNELYQLLNEERKNYEEKNSSAFNEALLWNKKQKRLTKYQKEMECLHIRRLSIYTNVSGSPQSILFTISKIFLKNVNEFVKMKKFNRQGFQQTQLDLNLIKYFFRENLIIDLENILDGFFLEIMKNCSFNAINAESFDETLISGLLDEHRTDFKKMLQNYNINPDNNI